LIDSLSCGPRRYERRRHPGQIGEALIDALAGRARSFGVLADAVEVADIATTLGAIDSRCR